MSNEITKLRSKINTWTYDLDDRRAESEADILQASVARRKLKKLVASEQIDAADHTEAIGELRAQIAEIERRQDAFPAIEDELERRIAEARAEIKRIGQLEQLSELERLKADAQPLRKKFAECIVELTQIAQAERTIRNRREELRNLIFERFQAGDGVSKLPDWGDSSVSRFDWSLLGSPDAVAEAKKRLAALS